LVNSSSIAVAARATNAGSLWRHKAWSWANKAGKAAISAGNRYIMASDWFTACASLQKGNK
jgi:hypothetical protein